jgi:hypothetical protein
MDFLMFFYLLHPKSDFPLGFLRGVPEALPRNLPQVLGRRVCDGGISL